MKRKFKVVFGGTERFGPFKRNFFAFEASHQPVFKDIKDHQTGELWKCKGHLNESQMLVASSGHVPPVPDHPGCVG
jgi:hypothetical protein